LTSPPPISPRENNRAPTTNTPAAHSAPRPAVTRVSVGAVATWSGHRMHKPTTNPLGMISRRKSSMAEVAIRPANPARGIRCKVTGRVIVAAL
jgi:hypothetical protein